VPTRQGSRRRGEGNIESKQVGERHYNLICKHQSQHQRYLLLRVNLLRQVIVVASLFDHVELTFNPVNVLFLVYKDVFE
jgi:hypothetical protein